MLFFTPFMFFPVRLSDVRVLIANVELKVLCSLHEYVHYYLMKQF